MNKKMSKALAVALSAAMAASAFAIGTGSAFAAPTNPTAQATLDATKSIPQYLWNDDDQIPNNKNKVDKIKVDLKTAYDPATLLDNATLTLQDGSTVKLGDTTANFDQATFTSDNEDIAKVDNGKIYAMPEATGTAQVTISGVTVAKDGTTYKVDPITLDVEVISPNDYSEGVWSKENSSPKAFTNEVNVGDSVYLYEAKAGSVQTTGGFATFTYTQLKTDAGKPRKGYFSASSVEDFDSLERSGSTFRAVATGSGTVDYYASNKAVENENPTAKASQELTVKGVYTGVSRITKKKDGTYDVKAGSTTVNLTADELANGTFQLVSTVKGIYNADGAEVSGGIKIDTKIGTVETAATDFTVRGVEIDTVKSTAASGSVKIENTANAKSDEDIAASVGTVDSEKATVVVGAAKSTTASISVGSIVADNVTVNSNKAEIGSIAKKTTATAVTVAATAAGVELPALDGYGLNIYANTTVASIANAKASTISGATLTVSGAAEFEGAVAGGGTIAIAPASLTIVGSASDKFTLDLTEVTAGATAFKTSTKLDKTNYTQKSATENGSKALANISTPGYTAVADDNYNAVIDQTIVAGGIQDATSGAVYNEKTGCYDLEISDGEVATLALQPKNVDSLGKTQYINWTLSGNRKGTVAATDNWMMGGVYSDGKTKPTSTKGGLTQTISADYVRNYSANNTAYVTATLQGSDPVVYCIKVVNEKTTQTTGFSLTASANYVRPGDQMTIYATPNGSQNLTNVRFSSSDTSVATVTPGTQGKSNWSAKVTGVKNGTAVITVVGTVADGSQVTETMEVSVTATPVLAYVDGKLVGPTDMIDVAQSTSKDVTFFSVDGKTIDSFNYVTGNGKVIGTNTLNKWNGTSGAYQVYAAGKVDEATGIYVNGQKVFMAKVTERPFTSDTTMNVNLPVGKTYSFKISLEDKSAPFTFTTANGTALSTSYNKAYYPDANGDYICTIKAEKAVGGVGVYVNIAGVNYKVFTAVTQ